MENQKITYDMLNTDQMSIADAILPLVENVLRKTPKELEQRIFSIQGFSGSGKSTLMSILLGEFKKMNNPKIVMTTTTHKSLSVLKEMAIEHNLEAKTIHSYLNVKVVEDYSTGLYRLEQEGSKECTPIDLLVVDEVSMCGADLYELIQNEMIRGTIKCVIFSGDKNQLKPVSGEDFPLYSGLIDHTEYMLTQITRQAEGSPIIELSTWLKDMIHEGKFESMDNIVKRIKSIDAPEIELFSRIDLWTNRFAQSDMSRSLIVAHKNTTVNLYNKKARELDLGKGLPYLVPMENLIFQESHFDKDRAIHQNNEKITIQECEMVEDEQNDLTYWRVLDTGGEVFRVVDRASLPYYEENLKDIAKEAKKEKNAGLRSELWRRYFELKKAFQKVSYKYASTIFKSQGSSVTDVYIDLNEIVQASAYLDMDKIVRLLYVGITRAREKVIFFIK